MYVLNMNSVKSWLHENVLWISAEIHSNVPKSKLKAAVLQMGERVV